MEKGEFDERKLAVAMTGREMAALPARTQAPLADAALFRVRDLVVHGARALHAVHGVGFDVQAGEILGVAGVEGNGQRELVDAVAGLIKVESGAVHLGDREITGASPQELHAAGVSVIPEDRRVWGLVLDMSVADNLALAGIPAGQFSERGLVRWRSVRARARELLEAYDIRPADPDRPVISLSGGNQQKVVLARELSRDPKLLIAAHPTHGLDVGATEYVHRRLLEVRERGGAVLLVSHDLDELLKLSDRVIVLFRGRIQYEGPVSELSMDDLAMAMAGTATRDGDGAAGPVAAPEEVGGR
jgi:simple sugar transport system ATP-binding protein